MNNEYSWDMDGNDPTQINIFHNNKKVMSLYLGEAMLAAGRKQVMKIVNECDNTPWLLHWKEDALLCIGRKIVEEEIK